MIPPAHPDNKDLFVLCNLHSLRCLLQDPVVGAPLAGAWLREEGPGESPGAATVGVQRRQGAHSHGGAVGLPLDRDGGRPHVGVPFGNFATVPKWGCK